IDEVSMVDRGAGVGCKIVISKRADDGANELPPLSDAERERAEYEGRAAIRDQENIEKREYERIHGTGAADHGPADDDRSGPLYEHFLGIFKVTNKSFAADAAGDEATREDEAVPVDELDGPPPPPDGTSAGVPDKTIRFDVGDKTITARDERALARWLSVQERIHKSNSTEESTTMSLDLSAVVKAHGIGALCRHMIKSATSFGVDEHALVKLATEDAQRKYPTDTPAIAFSKLYTESNELRDAIEIAKGVALQNDVADALAQDSEAACAELTAIGKARWPSLSPAQRFARAFETNPTLAARAHRRPGPSTSFPHPAVAKAAPLTNVDGVTLTPQFVTETNVDNPEAALAQLREIGRQRWPSKSEAESFLLAITDAENADLVNRALARPTGSSPARQ